MLLPYLVIKKPQAELLIEWINIRLTQYRDDPPTDRMKTIFKMIRFMNIRGYGISHEEKLEIYQSTTWGRALELMKLMGS